MPTQADLERDALIDCLKTCGTSDVAAKRLIKKHELKNLNDLVTCGWTDDEVKSLIKAYNEHLTKTERSTIEIGNLTRKRLRALSWWLLEKKVYGEPLDEKLWTVQQMEWSMQEVGAYDLAAKAEKTAKATTPGKVVQDAGYDEFKRIFDTYVGNMPSAQGPMLDLRYLLRKKNPPATFVNEEEKRLYQVKMSGHQFAMDNKQLWIVIQRVTSGTSLYAYMQPFELAMDGRNGLLSMVDQCEGDDVVNTRVTMANRVISPSMASRGKLARAALLHTVVSSSLAIPSSRIIVKTVAKKQW